MSKEIKTVGARIRECRKEMGYSQETLAAMLYMKKTTICKYEKDLHDIPSSVFVELAEALHTTPNYLLLGDVEYYGAAEPPVRCDESHLSGLTEPPHLFCY